MPKHSESKEYEKPASAGIIPLVNLTETISKQLKISPAKVSTTIQLLDEGNTIPFISRYRKEKTGSLDEEQIRQIQDWVSKIRSLEDRRGTILASISEQGKLTPELEAQLHQARSLTDLEDLYAPYKPKRRTRASIAREIGLAPLAELILAQSPDSPPPGKAARPFLNDDLTDIEDALSGARDIIAEQISDHARIRQEVRQKGFQWGTLQCKKIAKAEDQRAVYQTYYDFDLRINRLRPHQVLAINRGEAEKILRVRIEIPERDWLNAIQAHFRPDNRSPLSGQLRMAIEDSASRLLLPAIERSLRTQLKETAEQHAIQVFADNLRALLSLPPLAGHVILGIDPGFRTGCKLAVIDPTGHVLDTGTIYPFNSAQSKTESARKLAEIIKEQHVSLIAIGNGTASRETELLVADLIRSSSLDVQYLIVNEAGASVYSASPLARSELPEMDVSLRGAVSIARRVQDPLAELVKIEPKAIGVGLYQHDVNQKALSESLYQVVESVVNQVGVDVSTASPALLTYVAGIGPKLAEKIVEYRDEHGVFRNRAALKNVPGLGEKSFQQAAGFLRIRNGSYPLDASAIHPESYAIAEAVLERADLSIDQPVEARKPALNALLQGQPVEKLAQSLGCGVPTLRDILDQLVRPGRDPREDAPPPILRSDVLSIDDLLTGMILKGTVRNVVDFGAFIDIGVKQDGLLHRSQIPHGTQVKVGDVIDVEILKIEAERGRISLGWARD